MTDLEYDNLEKRFIEPNKPFGYNVNRMPRKLKKKVKKYCGVFYKFLTTSQRLWQYLEKDCMYYKTFLIKKTIEYYNKK